jgi:hypothetical protein
VTGDKIGITGYPAAVPVGRGRGIKAAWPEFFRKIKASDERQTKEEKHIRENE